MSPLPRFLVGLAAMLGLGAAPVPASWAVYYGAPASPGAAPPGAFDLVVLEPDHPWAPKARREGQRVLAYLSLGEVHKTRPYYARAASALAGPNPDWPDAMRVDPRSAAWRSLVLDEVAPAILAKGYDGFFLDTLDVGGWLEGQGKHPGARLAMARLLIDLKARYPQADLLANGGLDLLPEAGGSLAGLVTESIFTDYDFKGKAYRRRPPADAAARAATFSKAGKDRGLAVYVIEYVDPDAAAARAEVAGLVRAAGFVPFVSDIGLSTLEAVP